MENKILVNLPPEEYEHPFDKSALAKLRSLKGFDTFTNVFLNWGYVRWEIIQLQGSNFQITRESCPDLYEITRNVATTLSVDDFPDIYSQWGYYINGFTTGYKERTIMVLNSGAIDLLPQKQLCFIIGHEMGHIKSGHVIYHQMASLFSDLVKIVPLGESLLGPIKYWLLYWDRMSEFTADRAGLLACQDKEEALKTIVKMSGVPIKYFESLNTTAFLKQAEEFERLNSGVFDSAIKTISILTSTHPWTVYRAGELYKWVESGEYERIITKFEGVPCKYCGNIVAKDATYCHVHGGHPFE